MSSCIICESEKNPHSLEHIIPGALGNVHYVLHKGKVCRNCNTRFARWEHSVLNSRPWLEERQRLLQFNRTIQPLHDVEPEHDLKLFLIKILFESIHKSRPQFVSQIQGEKLRKAILGKGLDQFSVINDKVIKGARPIPRWIDRIRLKLNHLSLGFQVTEERIFFEFQFGRIFRVLVYKKEI